MQQGVLDVTGHGAATYGIADVSDYGVPQRRIAILYLTKVAHDLYKLTLEGRK